MKQNAVKITFSGDIMCDMRMHPAYKTESGGYDFSAMFAGCANYLAASDYVVGNLETPISNANFSDHPYKFNSPVELAEAVRAGGFTMVTTANNHCLDRGVVGLENTMKSLDSVGIKHTGMNRGDALPTGLVENIGGMRIGFLSYTYGTNAFENHQYLDKSNRWKVNLYQEQELHNPLFRRFYNSKFNGFLRDATTRLRRLFSPKFALHPVWERSEKRAWRWRRMKEDIRAFRSMDGAPEYIVMCLHGGGQLNGEPLKYLKRDVDKMMALGIDAMIVNHEHVIHRGTVSRGRPIVFSLGNFASNMGVHLAPYDKMADYSILFNLHLAKDGGVVRPVDFTFSITKLIPDGANRTRTVMLYDLINKCADPAEREKLLRDNLRVHNLFRNSDETEIELKLEYGLT